jgi:transcriptional regulator with XRE-family HTH domain
MSLGSRLQLLLDDRAISQAQVARDLGIEQQILSALIKRNSVRSVHAQPLADYFQVHLRWLLSGIGPRDLESATVTPAPAPALRNALPVVLDAIAACPARAELERLLPLLVTGAQPYRDRVAELLDPVAADVAKATTPVASIESPRFQPQQLGTTERPRE